MNNNVKRATTVALTVFALGSLGLPAKAFDFTSILQNLSHGVSDWSELDARESEISAQLTAAAASGQLTPTEADGFKFELTRVMQVEAQIKASGRRLGATDSISFTNSLNNLTNRINIAIVSKAGSAGLSLTAVETQRAQLIAQATEARNNHTLTRTDFEIIRRDLEHNANIQNAFTVSGDGAVTTRQAQVLSDDLARIKIAIDQHLTIGQAGVPQLTSQRALIEQRITSGLASGTIRDFQAADFRAELVRIANMQTNFLTMDGVLSSNELIALAGELDRLSSRVDYQISVGTNENSANTRGNGNGWGHRNGYGNGHGYGRDNGHTVAEIDDRRAQFLTQLNSAQTRRKISGWVATKLRRQLDQIAQSEAQSKLSGGGRLSFEQSTKLWTDLTQLQLQMDNQLAARANGMTGSRQY
jgi:hypothetical protein